MCIATRTGWQEDCHVVEVDRRRLGPHLVRRSNQRPDDGRPRPRSFGGFVHGRPEPVRQDPADDGSGKGSEFPTNDERQALSYLRRALRRPRDGLQVYELGTVIPVLGSAAERPRASSGAGLFYFTIYY